MITKLWAISRTTFLQTIRQPVYLVLILATFIILLLNVPLSGFTVDVDYHTTDQKMMVNLSLSSILVTGLLVAAFSATNAVAREIETRTALTVVSKPVSRSLFVFGKFAGITAAVVLAVYLCSLMFLATVRHKVMPAASDRFDWPVIVIGTGGLVLTMLVSVGGNLLFNWTFTSATVWVATIVLSAAMGAISIIGKGWVVVPFGEGISPQIIVAMLLIMMAVIVFVAVAVAASTRMGQVMTLAVCGAIFFIGSMHASLFPADTNIVVLKILGMAVPNLQLFYPFDALMQEKVFNAQYIALSLGYCSLYSLGVLGIGIAFFYTHPMESQPASAAMPSLANIIAWAGRVISAVSLLAGLGMVSFPKYYNPMGFTTIACLVIAGIAGWIIFGLFGRGVKWAYYFMWVFFIPVFARSVAAGFGLGAVKLPGEPQAQLIVQAVISALVIIALILPKTRYHFKQLD